MTDYYTSDGQPVRPQDLPRLSEEEQLQVMEAWFRTGYEDPAERTPYESAEGGYIWIWGGPYDADEVLCEQFGDIVSQDLLQTLAEDLDSECSLWAPTERPGDDDDFISDIAAISDYHANFTNALKDIHQLAATPLDDETAPCLFRLLYSNVITALETFLSDAFTNTVLNDPRLLRTLIETTPDFKKQRLSLSDIYNAVDNADQKARDFLRQILWHDLARVMPMYRDVLGLEFPDSTPMFRAIKIRHDLVHRNGKTKTGKAIPIDKGHVFVLAQQAEEFVRLIDLELQRRLDTVTGPDGMPAKPPF